MLSFQVDDMSCAHCVGVITRAVQATDPVARVTVDLARHLVQIDSSPAAQDAACFDAAIREAGYTPVAV